MTIQLQLDYPTLYDIVARSLSVIGKRSIDDKGNLLFQDITLGSREKEIITDYFRQAVIDLSAALAAHITDTTPATSAAGITITITLPDNHPASLSTFIQDSAKAYCVSYALASWFNVTAPRLVKHYEDDCIRQLAAITRLVHDKRAPSPANNAPSPLSVTTTIT